MFFRETERQRKENPRLLFLRDSFSKKVSLLFCNKGYDQARAVSTKL